MGATAFESRVLVEAKEKTQFCIVVLGSGV